jgi:hypothetical protein
MQKILCFASYVNWIKTHSFKGMKHFESIAFIILNTLLMADFIKYLSDLKYK